MAERILTAARLREVLHYNQETGAFTWRVYRGRTAKVGSVAGSLNNRGYIGIRVDGKRYLAHRLAWLYVYGVWPVDEIDHVDGKRTSNQIANLRECSRSENGQNLSIRASSTSGFIGVCFDRERAKWMASIQVNGKLRNLGRFSTPEKASAAYQAAKAKLHSFNPTAREPSLQPGLF